MAFPRNMRPFRTQTLIPLFWMNAATAACAGIPVAQDARAPCLAGSVAGLRYAEAAKTTALLPMLSNRHSIANICTAGVALSETDCVVLPSKTAWLRPFALDCTAAHNEDADRDISSSIGMGHLPFALKDAGLVRQKRMPSTSQLPVPPHSTGPRIAASQPKLPAQDATPGAAEPNPILSGSHRPAAITVADSEAGSTHPQEPPLLSTGAQVQSLHQALSRTYQTNPTLMARRAELRGLDNAVALERAGGLPLITAGTTFGQELYVTRRLGSRGRTLRSDADFVQVLYAGGRIRNGVRSAQTRVLAGRADLRGVEGNILTEAIGAYADVLRDRDIRDLNQSQVSILMANLQSTRARFVVRDLTLADVAQSEARLEVAKSNLATAEGQLQESEENFERIVGARAGLLAPLPPMPPLPLSSEQAVETALANNAFIAAFAARARAAGYDVAAAQSELSPTLSVFGSIDNVNALGTANSASGVPPGTLPNSDTSMIAGFSLRVPLYQGGAVGARIRQNEETRTQFIEEAIAVERLVIADTRSAFAIWYNATRAISFNEMAVASNEKALDSIKVEQTVGVRDIIDVLNAEQELLNSKVALTSARRDAYVTAFELLNAMGASEAVDLNIETGRLYDPDVNYKRYSDTWSDWDDGRRQSPASTRNVPAEIDSPMSRLNAISPAELSITDK